MIKILASIEPYEIIFRNDTQSFSLMPVKISQAVLYLQKLPDNFTQENVDDYLSMLLERNQNSKFYFKHTVFRLKDYYKYMGLKEPCGLVLPKVRKPKRLPLVIAKENVSSSIISRRHMSRRPLVTIYDCAFWVNEAFSLKRENIFHTNLR